MNEELAKTHRNRLKTQQSLETYATTCTACEARPGGMDDVAQGIAADIAMLEDTKIMYSDDIAKRGAVIPWHNGRQNGYKENPSMRGLTRTMEQQRKHLNELRLTPACQRQAKAATIEEKPRTPEDEFDEFPEP
ncbi:MAG: hypothetical protein RSE23_01765 [Clostridia bacterium]